MCIGFKRSNAVIFIMRQIHVVFARIDMNRSGLDSALTVKTRLIDWCISPDKHTHAYVMILQFADRRSHSMYLLPERCHS